MLNITAYKYNIFLNSKSWKLLSLLYVIDKYYVDNVKSTNICQFWSLLFTTLTGEILLGYLYFYE